MFFAQNDTITVSGTLTDNNGNPLYVYIYQYRYLNYARTDANGYYSIDVIKGNKLRYYYYENSNNTIYEAEINNPNIVYTNYKDTIQTKVNNKSKKKIKGFASVDDAKFNYNNSTSIFSIYGLPIQAMKINSISSIPTYSNIKIDYDPITNIYSVNSSYYKTVGYNLKYSASFTFDEINKLPDLQNTFSQGENGVVSDNSLFSFGNKIDTSTTKTYNPNNIFKKGYNFNNSLKLDYKLDNLRLIFSYNNNHIAGIIPSTYKDRNSFRFRLVDYKFKGIDISTNVSFTKFWTNFPENGANYTHLLKSIYTTPVNFDNENQNYQAYNTNATNPYWLLKNNYDSYVYEKFGSNLKLSKNINNFNFWVISSFENFKELKNSGGKSQNSRTDFFNMKYINRNNISNQVAIETWNRYNRIANIFSGYLYFDLLYSNNFKNVKYNFYDNVFQSENTKLQRITNILNLNTCQVSQGC